MKFLLLIVCTIATVLLHVYIIEAMQSRVRKSCNDLEETCTKSQLAIFEELLKPETVCPPRNELSDIEIEICLLIINITLSIVIVIVTFTVVHMVVGALCHFDLFGISEMKLWLLLIVCSIATVLLHVYIIKTMQSRVRKSCNDLEETCTKSQLAIFEELLKPETVCPLIITITLMIVIVTFIVFRMVALCHFEFDIKLINLDKTSLKGGKPSRMSIKEQKIFEVHSNLGIYNSFNPFRDVSTQQSNVGVMAESDLNALFDDITVSGNDSFTPKTITQPVPSDVLATSSLSDEGNTAESCTTDGGSISLDTDMCIPMHYKAPLKPNLLDETSVDSSTVLLAHRNRKYRHDNLENCPRFHEAKKPKRFSMSAYALCLKPEFSYPLRKTNSEPNLEQLRGSDGGEVEFETLYRTYKEHAPLPSEFSGRLYSSGSSTSTHIYLGDTSYLGVEEGGENEQEEEEEVDQNEYENNIKEGREDIKETKEEKEDQEEENRSYNNYKTIISTYKLENTLTQLDIRNLPSLVGERTITKAGRIRSNQRDQNDLRSYYQDGGTQTKSQNLPRTIFNTDWAAEASFDFHGGELQTENSSVKLIVTPDTVKESESITINAHVHVNIKKLTEVLKIPKDEFIVSPAPEYHLNADWKKVIKKPMIILLPVVLPTTFITKNLIVYVFRSVAGRVVKYLIGEKSKQNDNDQETYFEVSEDRKNILIYTYHFSGVVACYKCSKDVLVPGYLNARIKGSNTQQKHGREVRIQLEIAAEKNGIKDFEEQRQRKNVHNGLVLLEELRVDLPAKVDKDSKMIIRLDVTGDENHLWGCKKYSSGEELFQLEKEVYIKDMITCSAHNDPFCTEWVMCGTSMEPLQPFECVISVYEKNSDETEGAVAISSISKFYVTLSEQLGFEAAALSRMEEMFAAMRNRDSETSINPDQVVGSECIYKPLLAQESKAYRGRNVQPTTDSFNRSMPGLINRDNTIGYGIQEVGVPPRISRQASNQKELSEGTDGPQGMAELDLNETDHRLPCENLEDTECPEYSDHSQTVPKEN